MESEKQGRIVGGKTNFINYPSLSLSNLGLEMSSLAVYGCCRMIYVVSKVHAASDLLYRLKRQYADPKESPSSLYANPLFDMR